MPRQRIERERRTTVNHAMKTCRRAWNVAARRNPGKVPALNPFAQMGLRSSDRETPTATFAELQAFRVKAIEMGHPSLATAALIAWEWLQRERDIFAHLRRDALSAEGTAERGARAAREDRRGELDSAVRRKRRAALPRAYVRTRCDQARAHRRLDAAARLGRARPWPTWPTADEADLTHMSRKVKEVIRAAGLRDELTFTSFRHGGFTEGPMPISPTPRCERRGGTNRRRCCRPTPSAP